MNPEQRQRLGDLLHSRRIERGLAAREVARQASVDVTTVTRLEQGEFASPRPEVMRAIAAVLDIPAADLFAIAQWLPAQDLPTFRPYLRAKYKDLPDEAVNEIETYLNEVSQRYGIGPAAGQDEKP